jgi:ABC-type Co2+ transport system permease subunit
MRVKAKNVPVMPTRLRAVQTAMVAISADAAIAAVAVAVVVVAKALVKATTASLACRDNPVFKTPIPGMTMAATTITNLAPMPIWARNRG